MRGPVRGAKASTAKPEGQGHRAARTGGSTPPTGANLRALDAIADVVLAYKPRPKSKAAKRRNRKGKNHAEPKRLYAKS